MTERDKPMRCLDCRHLWPRFKTVARCENHRRAGLPGCWLALDFAELAQQSPCPGYEPKTENDRAKTEPNQHQPKRT